MNKPSPEGEKVALARNDTSCKLFANGEKLDAKASKGCVARKKPKVSSLHTAVAFLAAARSRFGSDSPPDCHSLPKRRDGRFLHSKIFMRKKPIRFRRYPSPTGEGFISSRRYASDTH